MRIQLLISPALLLTALAASHEGTANATLTCGTPSATDCVSTDYQQGPCFASTKWACASVYESQYRTNYAASSAPVDPQRLVPETGVTKKAPNSFTPTKVLPKDPGANVAGAPGSYAAYMYQTRYKATSTPITASTTRVSSLGVAALKPKVSMAAAVGATTSTGSGGSGGTSTAADPPWWSRWVGIGGYLSSAPAVAEWAPGRLDAFYVGPAGTMKHRWQIDGQWSYEEDLGGSLTSDPAVVSWGNGRLDIFARGTDNSLQQIWYQGGWGWWNSWGGYLTSAPAVAAWGNGRLDVFARGGGYDLQHIWWQGALGAWESWGGYLTAGPSAAAWGDQRLDVFVRGGDNALWHRWWDHGSLGGWESWGGQLSTSPAASSTGIGVLDIFYGGVDSTLRHKRYFNGLQPEESFTGTIVGAPGAVSYRGHNRIDVLARGTDNTLLTRAFTPPPPASLVTTFDPRPAWAANGNRIASCEEYTYEKYYTFSQFEDKIASMGYRAGDGSDWRNMFAALNAATPGANVSDRTGLHTKTIAIQDPNGPKNAFFATLLNTQDPNFPHDYAIPGVINPYEVVVPVFDKAMPAVAAKLFPWDPSLVSSIAAGNYIGGRGWTWHETYGPGFLASTADDQFQLFSAMKDRYALRQQNMRGVMNSVMSCVAFPWAPSAAVFPGGVAPDGVYCSPDAIHFDSSVPGNFTAPGPRAAQYASDMAMISTAAAAEVQNILLEAKAFNCLDPSTPQACDWSPRDFVNRVLADVRSTEEDSYAQCMKLTHNDFTSPESLIVRLKQRNTSYSSPYAPYIAPNTDGASSTSALDLVLGGFQAYANDLGFDRDPASGKILVAQTTGDNTTHEDTMFGVGLSYEVGWNLDNFTASNGIYPGTPPRGLCDAEAHVHGSAELRAKMLGHWLPSPIFSAHARVDTVKNGGHMDGDMMILGASIYSPTGDVSDISAGLSFDPSQSKKLIEVVGVVPVLGVPVTLKAGATGSVGIHGGMGGIGSGTPGSTATALMKRQCDTDPNRLSVGIEGTFKPWLAIDAYASASIDLGFVEGGIKGDLTLARLEAPLDAKIAITATNDPNVPSANIPLYLTVDTGMNLDFSTLDGRVSAFLDYTIGSTEKTLASWSGLHYGVNVFSRHATVPLLDLPTVVEMP